MVNCIATCGDSFGTGSGLPLDICYEKSFAGVVAEHYQLPQKVYARGGCCNFTIYLQVKKVIQRYLEDKQFNLIETDKFKPFVLITMTHHERLIIPLDDGLKFTNPDISQIDYKNYMPYQSDFGNRPMEFASTSTRLLTQTITNLEVLLKEKAGSAIREFNDLEKNKLNTLGLYYTDIFDTAIKKEYDDALIITIHSMLKFHNIPHLILTYAPSEIINRENRFDIHWGEYTLRYPDDGGSGHCNEEGNRLVGLEIIKHIDTYFQIQT